MQQTCFYFSQSKVTVAELFSLQQLYSLLIQRHESNKVLLTKPLSAVVATRRMIASVDPELSLLLLLHHVLGRQRPTHSFVQTMQCDLAKYCSNRNSIPCENAYAIMLLLNFVNMILFY